MGSVFPETEVLSWLIVTALFMVNLSFRPKGLGVAAFDGITINDTTYAGEVLESFIALATTTFQTLEKGCINVLPGIKKKETIPTISIDAFIQARAEKPVHGGDVNVGARTLEPKDVMGYLEFNPRKFEQHWLAVQMNPALLDAALPATAESAITQEVIKYNKNWLDRAVWQGVYDAAAVATALSNGLAPGDNNLIFFNGLLTQMFNDAAVQKIIAPTAVTLTAANIVSKMNAVKALLPQAVYQDPRTKYMMSYNSAELYADAQKNQANKGVDFTQAGVPKFDGKDVVSIAGMPDNTIVLCKGSTDLMSNLWLGVNEAGEEDYFQMARLQANSELYFLKMLMKLDTNYAFGAETALYTTVDYS